MRDSEGEIKAAGGRVAAVGLGDTRYAEAFKAESGIEFPLLVDRRREAYRAVDLKSASLLHMVRGDNVAAGKRAMAAGHRQQKLGKHPLQLGGSFVFAPGNVDLFAHVSETFSDNAAVSDLIAALP